MENIMVNKLKLNQTWKENIVVAIVVFFTLFLIVFIKDFLFFQDLTASQYKTPWYSNSIQDPYTTSRLFLANKNNINEYWTKNAEGSESWFVREVKVDNTTFWTILHRKELK